MIVRFPSAGAGSERPEGLAPVAYLPGVQPNTTAAQARKRIEPDRDPASAPQTDRDQAGPAPVGSDQNDSGDTRVRATTRAANVSIHQLARRGMSRWELQQVLERREVTDDVAAAELDRLERVGLLDDAALALTLVYTQHTRKGLGRQTIAHELRRRHIDQDIIDDALAEIEDDDERERALELAHKRVGQLHSFDDDTARRRLGGFLARKGYSSEIVRAAVESAMSTRTADVRFQ
ncbi:MAG: regulatory protein RecX [Microbacteriaceae bacterium]